MPIMKEEETQISARIQESEKDKLVKLAQSKGCEGITGLLRLLAKAKEVMIKEL